jgi:hypothetical protein
MSDQPGNTQENNIQQYILEAMNKLAAALKDAAELNVVTNVYIIDAENPNRKASELEAAKTIMKMDGDRDQWIPVLKRENNVLEVYDAIAEIHNQSLNEAIEYRKQALEMVLEFLRNRNF